MRVVIPVFSLHQGGGCRVLIEAANALTDRGHDVSVLTLEGEPVAWPLRCAVTRVPDITADSIPPADVILPNFWPTVWPAVLSGQGRAVRISNGFEPLWVKNREAAQYTYEIGLPVISISHPLRRIIRESTGQDSFVARPGVNREVFRPLGRKPGRTKRVLFIYRPALGYYYKGMEDFTAAMALVREAVPNVEAVLAIPQEGTEFQPPSLSVPHSLVMGANDQIMAQLYSSADLYVLASWFEALSLPPLEAMACGTPVVLTDCGGVWEYALPGENCLMAPPKRPDVLADLIITALEEPPLREQLIAGGMHTAADWTWQRFGEELEGALLTILDGAVEPAWGRDESCGSLFRS